MGKCFHYMLAIALAVSMAAMPALATDPVQENGEYGCERTYQVTDADNGSNTLYASNTLQRGKSGAFGVMDLIEWNGDVCYFNDRNDYTYINDMCCTYNSASDLITECTAMNPDTGLCDSGVLTTVYCDENVEKLIQVRSYRN